MKTGVCLKATRYLNVRNIMLIGVLCTVGPITTVCAQEHSYLIDLNSKKVTDLGTLGGDSGYAYGINASGQVVRNYQTTRVDFHAFITGPNGVDMVDLNSLVHMPAGVVLTSATGINDAGQVIAIGVVPEPESYALLLAGLSLIGFIVRRCI